MENKRIKNIILFGLACVFSFGCGYLFSNALKAKEKSRLSAPAAAASFTVNFKGDEKLEININNIEKFVEKAENREKIYKVSKEIILIFCNIFLICLNDPEVQDCIRDVGLKIDYVINSLPAVPAVPGLEIKK